MADDFELERSRSTCSTGRAYHHESLLGWWQTAIALLESDPRRRQGMRAHCAGVVIVHLDGALTCSMLECPLGEPNDPLVVAEKHKVFVSCNYVPHVRCPRCDSEVEQRPLAVAVAGIP